MANQAVQALKPHPGHLALHRQHRRAVDRSRQTGRHGQADCRGLRRPVSEGVYHVQTVNDYHKRFKTWVNRHLRGVSTKHLPSYIAWMRNWEWFKDGVKPEHFVVSGLGKQLINT